MMNVRQQIVIQQLRINAMSNSSVLQIGTAGLVKSLSNLYNTGRFTEPAPLPGQPSAPIVPLPPADFAEPGDVPQE